MAEDPTAANGQKSGARKRPEMEMPQELESRFLRVGDKLYRSAHDRNPIATVTPDRIKARDSSALPDLVRLAKANGWTSIKINGDADFKRAAYLAAVAQGLEIEGYKPDAKTRAAAARDIARQTGTEVIRPQAVEERKQPPQRTANRVRERKEKPDQRLDLAERFRRQSHAENAKDPALRRAQSHVAHALVIAAGRFPRDEERQRGFVDKRKEEVAAKMERGEQIAGVQVRQQQSEPIRSMEQNQILQRNRSPSR
jgi:hypothetical protein